MTALPVPGDPAGEFDAFTAQLAERNEQKSPGLVLSGAERTREALLAAWIAVEHARVVGPVDSRTTARYAARVVDNSRRLAAGDAVLHLSLFAGARGLAAGFADWVWGTQVVTGHPLLSASVSGSSAWVIAMLLRESLPQRVRQRASWPGSSREPSSVIGCGSLTATV